MVKVAPSVLSVSLENVKSEAKDLENNGADYIHIDVMDGKFVDNETLGIEIIDEIKNDVEIPLDTHLMVENPEDWIDDFSASDIISFHIEAVDAETAIRIIENLHEREIKVGIAIKPDTPVEEIIPYLDMVDLILIMTVEPGYGGQKLIENCISKISEVREIKPEIEIEVDGGITFENVQKVIDAGADIIVSGNTIMNCSDRKEAILKMRGI